MVVAERDKKQAQQFKRVDRKAHFIPSRYEERIESSHAHTHV